VQAGLELEILLPQPPKYWNYRHALPCPAKVQGILIPILQIRRLSYSWQMVELGLEQLDFHLEQILPARYRCFLGRPAG
jgi:hypothetical protein